MNQATTEQPSAQEIEAVAQNRIEGWLKKADILPCFPLNNREAISVISAVEYQANLDTIHEFVSKGYFTAPAKRGGSYAWSAFDIQCFAFALEYRERWIPFSSLHDSKKSAAKRGREIYEASGQDGQIFSDVSNYSVEDLLLILVRCDDQRSRYQVYEAVKIRMEQIADAD